MINPNDIINFNRTDAELEELILFLVAVAGKKASTVSVQLDNFLEPLIKSKFGKPFDVIRMYDSSWELQDRIRDCGFGCYRRLERAFRELAVSDMNLRTCTKEDLMQIHGIGRKSASCFLAWTRKGEKVAMLDTHLLKYLTHIQFGMKAKVNYHFGLLPDWQKVYSLLENVKIPKSTPSNTKLYDTLETAYLEICRIKKVNPTEYDLEIWRYYSSRLDKQKGKGIISV